MLREIGAGQTTVATILPQYLPAIRWHLHHSRGLHPADADDVLQEFVVAKLLQPHLIAVAAPDRGRFRGLLLAALNHFTIDWLRKHRRSLPSTDLIDAAAVDGEQSKAFEIAWARAVVTQAIDGVRQELCAAGKSSHWELFNLRVVQPALTGQTRPSYEDLRDIRFASVRDASNALVTAKRCFQRHLVSLIGDNGDAKEIGASLLEILSSRRARSTSAYT